VRVGRQLHRAVVAAVRFSLRRHPPLWILLAVSADIYANFYLRHYFFDVRLALFAALALLFGRTWLCFRIHRHWRTRPLLPGPFLVAVFIWIADDDQLRHGGVGEPAAGVSGRAVEWVEP
jgi:uncharacterized membrane protein YoaT (DUF817 family)